jgi:hypothetical protein
MKDVTWMDDRHGKLLSYILSDFLQILTGPRDATVPRVSGPFLSPRSCFDFGLSRIQFNCVLSTCCVNFKTIPSLSVIQDVNLVQINEKVKFEKLITNGEK